MRKGATKEDLIHNLNVEELSEMIIKNVPRTFFTRNEFPLIDMKNNRGQKVQVQIIITRDESDFIGTSPIKI